MDIKSGYNMIVGSTDSKFENAPDCMAWYFIWASVIFLCQESSWWGSPLPLPSPCPVFIFDFFSLWVFFNRFEKGF